MNYAKAAGRCGVLIGVVLLALAQVGHASITVSDLSHSVATGEYQYTIELNSTAIVKNGDGFVIYDFPGLITTGPDAPTLTPNVNTSPAFLASLDSTDLINNAVDAPSPSDVFPFTPNQIDNAVALIQPDNPTLPNLSFVYDGGTNLAPGVLTDYTLTLFSSLKGLGVTVTNVDTGSKDSPSNPDGIFSGTVSAPLPEPASLLGLAVLGAGILGGRNLRGRKEK